RRRNRGSTGSFGSPPKGMRARTYTRWGACLLRFIRSRTDGDDPGLVGAEPYRIRDRTAEQVAAGRTILRRLVGEIGEQEHALAGCRAFDREHGAADWQHALMARDERRMCAPERQQLAVMVEQRPRIAVLLSDRDAVIVFGKMLGPISLWTLVPI